MLGEYEQAACILHVATEERMRYQKLLSLSNVTIVVGSLWWYIVGTNPVRSVVQIVTSA